MEEDVYSLTRTCNLATGIGIVQSFSFGKSEFLGPDQNGSPWRGFPEPFKKNKAFNLRTVITVVYFNMCCK